MGVYDGVEDLMDEELRSALEMTREDFEARWRAGKPAELARTPPIPHLRMKTYVVATTVRVDPGATVLELDALATRLHGALENRLSGPEVSIDKPLMSIDVVLPINARTAGAALEIAQGALAHARAQVGLNAPYEEAWTVEVRPLATSA